MRLFKKYILLLLTSVCMLACGDIDVSHDTPPEESVSGVHIIKDNKRK